jgi:hypothetical protein
MITQSFLKEVLDYDPDTGVFHWRHREDVPREWNTRHAGKVAGTVLPTGYRSIIINNEPYLGHRLAWFYMAGEWPPHQVDHINRIRGDDRFANLRLATSSENKRNRPADSDSISGVKGVHWHKPSQRWHVRVCLRGREHSFGYFKTVEEAAEVARMAQAKLHGEFCYATL